MANLTVHELAYDLPFEAPEHRVLMHEEIHQRLGGAGFHSPPPPLGSGSDDRARLLAWFASSELPVNTTIGLQPGYLVSAPIPFPSGHKYVGRGVAENAPVPHIKLMNGANPSAATTGVVVAKEWDDNNTAGGAPTIFENLAIDGNAANNTGTYSCLLPFNYWTRIRDCRLDAPRLHHVLLTKIMKNGSASVIDHADNRLYGNRFRNGLVGTAGAGIRHLSTGGNNNMDVRVFDNHFESAQHGIWSDDAAGWTLFDNHIWARRNGINIESGFLATKVIANYIDGFGNENTAATTYYGIRVRGFNGHGSVVAMNNVDISEDIFAGIFNCYMLEAQNAGAHIAGGLNLAFGHSTPNAAHHGFIYTANGGLVINGQIGNTAVGFLANQDFEQLLTGGGTMLLTYPRPIQATGTFDLASLATATAVATQITVPGAAPGDPCVAALSTLTQNPTGAITVTARVTGTGSNNVTVTFRNDSGSAVDPASGTLRVIVWKTTA